MISKVARFNPNQWHNPSEIPTFDLSLSFQGSSKDLLQKMY